jgi:Type II secretion system protein B
MSYILDALTKAAQQRERMVPVVQRLLSPPAPRASWVRVPGRPQTALAVSAGLLAVLLIWWLRPVSSIGPADIGPADPSSAISASTPTPAPRITVELSRSVDRPEPKPRADVPAESPVPKERDAIVDAPAVTARPAPSPGPRSSMLLPQPGASAASPAAAVAPAAPSDPAGLKLEALIYSDLPAQRMVFINGRRYVEGDMVDGKLRVEEIQEEGVALSDQGRRFTLRATR